MAKPQDMVRIELPAIESKEQAQRVCDKANRMMERLGATAGKSFEVFEDKGRLYYSWGGDMGCTVLDSGGIDFSLDYLGRED